MTTEGPLVQVVAGEPSGDNHASEVVRELRKLMPGLTMHGFGGPRLAAAGMALDEDLASDAIMGFFPVIKALPRIRRLFQRAEQDLRTRPPDALLLVDYPGFNLRLAARAKRLGIPVIYYISPQVWAWAPWRARKIARLVDRMIVILPFEVAAYAGTGLDVVYTGHPVFDHLATTPPDEAFIASLRQAAAPGPLIGVFPGSRRHVVESLAPAFARTAARLRTDPRMQGARFVFGLGQPAFEDIVRHAMPGDTTITCVTGRANDVMRASDLCLTTSGTTTIEIAAVGRPSVIGYHTSPIFYALARAMVTVQHIGLVNLVAGERVVPEHVGFGDLSEGLARDLTRLWTDPEARERQLRGLAAVRAKLDTRGAYARAAASIAEFLTSRGRRPPPPRS